MLLIGYGNLVESATLSGGTWSTAAPRANVATWPLADTARTSSATTTATTLTLDHGSATAARVLAIMGHNLSAAATVRWMRGTTSGGSDVADTGAVDAWAITPRTTGGHHVLLWQTADTWARYDTVEIDDTANAAGYVEIGRLFVGPAVRPTYGQSYGLQDGLIDLSTSSRAEDGALWVAQRRTLRQVSLVMEGLALDVGDALHEMLRTHGATAEVVYLFDTADAAATQRYGFVGTAAEMTPLEYPYYRMRKLPLRITERA